jgi:hypothetical protein
MLSGRLPTGSIAEPRRRPDGDTRPGGGPGPGRGSGAGDRPADRTRADYEHRIAELEATVETLEAELDRREDERQAMVNRYERTLDARERHRREETTTRRTETPGRSLRDRVGDAVSRLRSVLD